MERTVHASTASTEDRGDPGPTLQAPDSAARLFGDNVVGIDQGNCCWGVTRVGFLSDAGCRRLASLDRYSARFRGFEL